MEEGTVMMKGMQFLDAERSFEAPPLTYGDGTVAMSILKGTGGVSLTNSDWDPQLAAIEAVDVWLKKRKKEQVPVSSFSGPSERQHGLRPRWYALNRTSN